MRRPIIIGNWKMNKTKSEAIDLINKLKELELDENVDKVICVPFLYATLACEMLKDTSIKVGVQNMYYFENGAFTGEISPIMLKSCGISHVIIGHSERRNIFKESDEEINKKVSSALNYGLTTILCCGESLLDREKKIEKRVIEIQIRTALENIELKDSNNLIIAYEPVWAIGTGLNASSKDAEEMLKYIRLVLKDIYGEKSEYIRLQYGGSVNLTNIKEFMNEDNIDGTLVGGASLDADSFSKLINYKK